MFENLFKKIKDAANSLYTDLSVGEDENKYKKSLENCERILEKHNFLIDLKELNACLLKIKEYQHASFADKYAARKSIVSKKVNAYQLEINKIIMPVSKLNIQNTANTSNISSSLSEIFPQEIWQLILNTISNNISSIANFRTTCKFFKDAIDKIELNNFILLPDNYLLDMNKLSVLHGKPTVIQFLALRQSFIDSFKSASQINDFTLKRSDIQRTLTYALLPHSPALALIQKIGVHDPDSTRRELLDIISKDNNNPDAYCSLLLDTYIEEKERLNYLKQLCIYTNAKTESDLLKIIENFMNRGVLMHCFRQLDVNNYTQSIMKLALDNKIIEKNILMPEDSDDIRNNSKFSIN